MSPTPFHCHTCDKPTMNSNGVCDSCLEKQQVSVYLNSFNKTKSFGGIDLLNTDQFKFNSFTPPNLF